MKLKILIPAVIGVLLVAAALLYGYAAIRFSQSKLDQDLVRACRVDNAAAAAYCLAKGADPNAQDPNMGRTPLHECAHFSSARGTQELLLLAGADVDAVDNYGRTPLYYTNFADVAKTLVSHGADLDVRDNRQLTPLEARQKEGWHLPDDLKAVLEGKDREELRRTPKSGH